MPPRSRGHGCALLFALLLTTSPSSGQGSPASASELRYSAKLVQPNVPVPGNGALLIRTTNDAMPSVDVRNTAQFATAVPGITSALGPNLWTWVAKKPLLAGAYRATTQAAGMDVAPAETHTIAIVAARPLDKPELSVTATLRPSSEPGAQACCQGIPGTELDNASCFQSTSRSTMVIDVSIASSAPPELRGQFLFRTVALPDDRSGELGFSPLSPEPMALTYREQANDYCFKIHAINLATREMPTYAELTPCLAHGTHPGFEDQAIAIPSALLDRSRCRLPPESLRGQWCEVNGAVCDGLLPDELVRNDCRLYGHNCLGEPLPANLPPAVDDAMLFNDTGVAGMAAPEAQAGGIACSTLRSGAGARPHVLLVTLGALLTLGALRARKRRVSTRTSL